jgi:SAM-dependent methyltransferase
MSALFPFVPDRFASTAGAYTAYRLGYPDRLLVRIAERLGLPGNARILDLGCGPGMIAIGFARFGYDVMAMDPDEAMLAAGKAEAAAAGVAVDWRLGSSFDLRADLGEFDLVTIGRAFHWMDRAATLRSLEGMVRENGGIALLTDERVKGIKNPTDTIIEEVRTAFAGHEELFSGMRSGKVTPHARLLLESTFSDVERIGLIETRRLPTASVVGRALTYSHLAPAMLGELQPAVVALLEKRLAAVATDGHHDEVVEFEAIVARRRARD